MRSIVGIERSTGRDVIADGRNGSILGAEHERKATPVALAHDNYATALAVLINREATVAAVLFPIRWLHIATKIRAVDFYRFAVAANLADAFRGDGFADFVRQDESGFVLAIQIAGELKGGMALCAVRVDSDAEEIVTDWALVRGEDGAARRGELMAAALTLENRASLVGQHRGAATRRAVGLAVVISPPDSRERLTGLLLAHAGNGA